MKKVTSILLIVLVVFSLSAIDFSQAMDMAMANSRDAKNSRSNYEYQTLYLKTADMKNGISVTAELSDLTVSEDLNFLPNARITMVLPEFIDDMTVKATVSGMKGKTKDKYNVVPSLDVSKIFTFRDYGYSQEELLKEKNRINTDSQFESSMLSAKSSFIDALEQIMQAEVNLEKQKTTLEKLEKELSSRLITGAIDAGSIAEINARKEITSAEQSLKTKTVSLKNLIDDFKDNYGFDYSQVTNIPEADLAFTYSPEKSITVKKAEIDLETAKQKLEEKTGTKTTLTLGANASSSMEIGENRNQNSANLNASVSAKVDLKNLSMKVSYNGVVNDGTYTSSVTLSGNWSNDPKPSDSSKLEILELQNNLISAQNKYDDAVKNYIRNSEALESDIELWYETSAQQEIDNKYDLEILEHKKELYALGYITETELKDAMTTVKTDEVETLAIKLEALKLQYRIEKNNL